MLYDSIYLPSINPLLFTILGQIEHDSRCIRPQQGRWRVVLYLLAQQRSVSVWGESGV
jgi:hypothetical protein